MTFGAEDAGFAWLGVDTQIAVRGSSFAVRCSLSSATQGPRKANSEERSTIVPLTLQSTPMNEAKHAAIRAYYDTLFSAWGRQYWWPAQSRFEVIVGAYLTQNTAWTNVEKALSNLRKARRLTVNGIRRTPQGELEQWIRPSGYFRQKAARLKTFVHFLDERYGGSLARMFAQPTAELRTELLSLHGVGPETADSILLYAGNHPVFVVDAYTRRILERHGIVSSAADYAEIRELFEDALGRTAAPERFSPPRRRGRRENARSNSDCFPRTQRDSRRALGISADRRSLSGPRGCSHRPSRISTAERTALAQVFNEMHGLIVGVGKTYCLKSQPRCELCPLQKFLPEAK
jgi:endonuclease-3 related protein